MNQEEREAIFHENTCLIRSLESMLTQLANKKTTLSEKAKKQRQETLRAIHSNETKKAFLADQELIPQFLEDLANNPELDIASSKLLKGKTIMFQKGDINTVLDLLKSQHQVAFVTVRPSEKLNRLVPHIFHVGLSETGNLRNLSDKTKADANENSMQLDADFQLGEFILSDLKWNILAIK